MEWFAKEQLNILARSRRQVVEKLETEVLELIEAFQSRKSIDFITARDVHRARIVSSAPAAAALLAKMETEGLLIGEDVRPPHGGKTTRIFRAAGNKNPVPG